ncbi:response regulator transcription factor [Alkalimonas amylolytica]|uniref:Two component transcriptional regulator, LuxR family n=1 Tax=Alkalimonas amylolytica TaxID=152573 RepID=A0A1H4CIR6_ALKAM|nr:response regulator transcription factor [Alkalimonas amylolytica]SEA60234.1 two component transcriptional regulator, LuxR family [Alkalimonas amylolytica]
MIGVMVVDDQTLVRQGIASLLQLSEQVRVLAEAASAQEALEKFVVVQPDVILMDIRMPQMSGIEALRRFQQFDPAPPVIMLTTFDEQGVVMQAMQAGAKGYLLKDVSLDRLVDCIVAVRNGKTMIQPAVTEKIMLSLQGVAQGYERCPMVEAMTNKEIEVLRLMASGLSNREIAEALFKSEGTVKNQVSAILAKLGVRDRTRAVLSAIDAGII